MTAAADERISASEFLAAAPGRVAAINGNTPWAQRMAEEVRQVVYRHAANAPRTLQSHLGPSEIGHRCDRQVVGKLAALPATNHVLDPWPAIRGTALHAWLEGAFTADNARYPQARWATERRVAPHPEHPGTADLYDAVEQSVDDHKGVWINTPIATPSGWATMGQLEVGDQVFGSDGQPCTVVRTYPVQQRDCYRIRFTDGVELVTDDVQVLPFRRVTRRGEQDAAMSVTEAREHVWSSGSRPQRQLRLYHGAALELPDRDLEVHPYVLGCWLGDGDRVFGVIGSGDPELYDHIEACDYRVSGPHGRKGFVRTVYGLSVQLRKLGLQWVDPEHSQSHRRLAGRKVIPPHYLRASRDQRLALLQGLMDTDGTWNRARHQAVFINTDKALAHDVAELVTSLGWRVKVFPQSATGYGKTVTVYHVAFTPFGDAPFRLARKAEQVRLKGSRTCHYRVVESIEPTVCVPTRCIDVDSSDHLYRCGEAMVPVHNCLGDTTMTKIRNSGPPIHYFVQLLLYALGYRLEGYVVRRVAIFAYPATAGSLDGLYVWEHELTPADDELLKAVFARLEWRKQWAAALVAGTAQLLDVPSDTSDSCHFCPFYRPQSAHDGGPGCPGHAAA